MPASPIAIRARDVVLVRDGHTALRPSSFEVPSGSLTAVIGPNGSGKSTLLDGISGLLPVEQGSLEVLGTSPRRARPRVAYVLQTTTVNEVLPLTAREVVLMARYPRRGLVGRLRPADRAVAEVAMERLGVAGLARRHLHELSGGQRQRILVAQGLAQEADLLLLDEPLAGVDVVSRERILQVMAEEHARGRTLVVTTHDLAEAARADLVLLLGGRVVAAGPPESVLTREHLAEAYAGALMVLDDRSAVLDDHRHDHDHDAAAVGPAGIHPGERPEGEPAATVAGQRRAEESAAERRGRP